jgi:hypothetical protein
LPEDAINKVLELLETNGGCELPCWWGITPGETSWIEASNYLNSFADRVTQVGIEPIKIEGLDGYFGADFRVPEEVLPRGELNQLYFVIDGIVEKIETETTMKLADFFTLFGEPQDIWVRTLPMPLEGYLEFWIALYYPDQRIVAVFLDERSEYQKDEITGCFLSTYEITLWSPKETVSLEDIQLFGTEDWPTYPTFEEATGETVTDFFSFSLSNEGKACLTTPVHLWDWPRN